MHRPSRLQREFTELRAWATDFAIGNGIGAKSITNRRLAAAEAGVEVGVGAAGDLGGAGTDELEAGA